MGAFLSVIVPSRNRRAGLLRLLDSLVAQAGEVDFEVIAVLDGSTDGSAGALRGRPWPFPLSVIEQEHRGAGAARNAGTREASGEVCVRR